MSLTEDNLVAARDHAVHIERFLRQGPEREWWVDRPPPLAFWQHMGIELDTLRLAVEQRIQELGSHEPQELA